MPRSASEDCGSSRLKSLLSRSPLSNITTPDGSDLESTQKDNKKLSRPTAWMQHRRSATSTGFDMSAIVFAKHDTNPNQSKRMRSYSHLDLVRPVSGLGLSRTTRSPTVSAFADSPSRTSSENNSTLELSTEKFYGQILHHGPVQTSHFGWRKKSEYFVLTSIFLFRCKNIKRAMDMFPGLLPNQPLRRRSTSTSFGSMPEFPVFAGTESPTDFRDSSFEKSNSIPLNNVLSIRQIMSNRARATIELIWQCPGSSHPAALSVQFEHSTDRQGWLELLNRTVSERRQHSGHPLPYNCLQMASNALPLEGDPKDTRKESHRGLHIVVQRRSQHVLGAGYMSLDDSLSKEPPNLLVLTIKKHEVLIAPLTKPKKSATRSMSDLQDGAHSFGLASLVSVTVSEQDSSIDIVFRIPGSPPIVHEILSVDSHTIAQRLYHGLESVKPGWPLDSSSFRLPGSLLDLCSRSSSAGCYGIDAFESVLEAYCRSFGINISRICWNIDMDQQDSPCFQLLPPTDSHRSGYSKLELIATLRALRYNNFAASVSFAHVSLDILANSYDHFGNDHICTSPRTGHDLLVTHNELRKASVLIQELSAIVMTSKVLRKLDFTSTIQRSPDPKLEDQGLEHGCGILEALYPLCINQNTNVDWIVLNGIHLSRTDFDYIIGMLAKRDCHLRAIELKACYLDTWQLRLILSELPVQSATLEVIELSDNPGRISPDVGFDLKFGECKSLRLVNLSRVQLTPEPEPLIPVNVLSSWRLEDLRFSGTRLTSATLDTITSYLQSPSSLPLRTLLLDNTGISTNQIATLFQAVTSRNEKVNIARNLHIDVSGNNIRPFQPITTALAKNWGPTSLTTRFLDFQNEFEFSDLLRALRTNSSLRELDISAALFPYGISGHASLALQEMLSQNQGLISLNLSGENSRLESSTMGTGLLHALDGLKENCTLKTLSISDQQLGMEGASILAEVLLVNSSLTVINCERNNIPLAGVATLVQAVQHNTSILELTGLEDGKAVAWAKVQSAAHTLRTQPEHLRTTLARRTKFPNRRKTIPTLQPEIAEAWHAVSEKWDRQMERLEWYLNRNKRLALGEEGSMDRDRGLAEPSPTTPILADDLREPASPTTYSLLEDFERALANVRANS